MRKIRWNMDVIAQIFAQLLVISLSNGAEQRPAVKSATIIQSPTLKIQSPIPAASSYESKLAALSRLYDVQPGFGQRKPQSYKRYTETERPYGYGKPYDPYAAKKYEAKPEKVSYEIKVYIPKVPETPAYEAKAAAYPLPTPYEPASEYPPQSYEMPYYPEPKYEPKMSYVKPYYNPEGRVMYESKPAYPAPSYGYEQKPQVYEKPVAYEKPPVYEKPVVYEKPAVYEKPTMYNHRGYSKPQKYGEYEPIQPQYESAPYSPPAAKYPQPYEQKSSAYAEPSYPPAYEVPKPFSYNEPSYPNMLEAKMPKYEPMYEQKPKYNEPVYEAKVYKPEPQNYGSYEQQNAYPAYERPKYAEKPPVYEKPAYEKPVYEKPVYEKPVYERPVYEKPKYEAKSEPYYPTPAAPMYYPPTYFYYYYPPKSYEMPAYGSANRPQYLAPPAPITAPFPLQPGFAAPYNFGPY